MFERKNVILKEICNLVKKSPSSESKIREVREKKNIKRKGSEYSAQPVGRFMVRHVLVTITKNWWNYGNGHLGLLVLQRWKLELLELRISWKCSGSCLAVSLDIRYYNRQTIYQKHCKKQVLQLLKVFKPFSCIRRTHHWYISLKVRFLEKAVLNIFIHWNMHVFVFKTMSSKGLKISKSKKLVMIERFEIYGFPLKFMYLLVFFIEAYILTKAWLQPWLTFLTL